jgi:tetratricopeptide (TPR) repeat protein
LIAEKQGQWEEAERSYEKAVEVCRRFHLRADEAEVYFYLARLRSKTRNLDGARHALRAAAHLGVAELRPNLAVAFAELRRHLEPGAAGPPPTEPEGDPPAP